MIVRWSGTIILHLFLATMLSTWYGIWRVAPLLLLVEKTTLRRGPCVIPRNQGFQLRAHTHTPLQGNAPGDAFTERFTAMTNCKQSNTARCVASASI